MGRTALSTPTIAALALLLLVPLGCRQSTQAPAGGPIVRVRLLDNVDHVNVTASGQVVAKSSAENDARKLNFPSGSAVPVALAPDGWRVGNVVIGGGPAELKFTPAQDGAMKVDGKAYRGEYRLVPVSANRFDVVNDVPIDSYLKGVLPGELPSRWQIEAYKAQAITARTYALYEVKTRPQGRPFDLYDDTRSQVYSGMDAETSKSRRAADETAGIVVAYGAPGQEKIFKAYFSSCCGGVGQSNADAFNEEPIPPLMEQSVGGLCNASPKFNWPAVVIPKAELARRVRAWGARRDRPEKNIPGVARLDVAAVNQFNRPVRFVLTDTNGQRYAWSGEETRWACNADAQGGPILNSSFFKPLSDGDVIRFVDGHGYGHGVGLCQWCAEARAERGSRHEDIVLLAYPRAKLVRAY